MKIKNGLLILAVIFLLGITQQLEVQADYNREESHVYGDFHYAYDTETGYIWITNYTGNEKVVVVPAEINGVAVKYIGAFGDCEKSPFEERKDKVKQVQLPNGIESIYGFHYLVNLEKVNIPDSVRKIGNGTFKGCKKLEKISLPLGLEIIDDDAFRYCSKLKITQWPTQLKEIGDGAFSDCSKLKNIKLPDGLKVIRDGAFGGCSSITEITIPDSVTKVGAEAFIECSNLRKVKLSKNLKIIERDAFSGTYKLKKIEIPQKVTKIETKAFASSSISEITIPSNVTHIGIRAFAHCNKLKKITFKGSKVKTVMKNAFQGVHKNTVFNVPNKSINKYKKLLTSKTGFKKGTMKIK